MTSVFAIRFYVCWGPGSQFENIWLRTKRYNAKGEVVSGPGGVCYLYFPARPSARQLRALRAAGEHR